MDAARSLLLKSTLVFARSLKLSRRFFQEFQAKMPFKLTQPVLGNFCASVGGWQRWHWHKSQKESCQAKSLTVRNRNRGLAAAGSP